MYREKLQRKRSMRSALVRMLEKTLDMRQFVIAGHALRLTQLMKEFAGECNLPKSISRELELFVKFHDIGKVGMPDQILFKKGLLTRDERVAIQQHPEIGYRIAQASTELAPIAEWILKHHEWWDGRGYPLGLSGESIPIESRMLALLDAYDVMTNDDSYRTPLSKETAINEIKSLAGTKFDPLLTDIFVKMIEQKENRPD
jgi:HD-GYP domain-containing protein (c-di-GMP phosphodiesterase class II)